MQIRGKAKKLLKKRFLLKLLKKENLRNDFKEPKTKDEKQ